MKQIGLFILFLILIFLLSLFTFESKISEIKHYFYDKINGSLKENNLDFISARLKGSGLKSTSVVELKGEVFDTQKKAIAENIVKKIDVAIFVDNKIKIVKKPIIERVAKDIISDILEYPVDDVKSDEIKKEDKNITVKDENQTNQSTISAMECSKDIAILLFDKKINFESDSIEFTKDSYQVLDELIKIIKKCKDLKFDINGYTDSSGDRMKNLLLSGRRAEAVKNYLVKKGGFDAKRFRPIGYGPANPIADNKTIEGRAKNRRIEIVVIDE